MIHQSAVKPSTSSLSYHWCTSQVSIVCRPDFKRLAAVAGLSVSFQLCITYSWSIIQLLPPVYHSGLSVSHSRSNRQLLLVYQSIYLSDTTGLPDSHYWSISPSVSHRWSISQLLLVYHSVFLSATTGLPVSH